MLVKKLYRRVKVGWWNKERKTFEHSTVIDYIGWFLFGIIPIYIIELDRYEVFDDEEGESRMQHGIVNKFGHLIQK